MSLIVETPPAQSNVITLRDRRVQRGTRADRFRRLRVGLVNNMPDSAVHATERQFSSLLIDAGDDFDLRLTLVGLNTLPREKEAREAMAPTYRDPQQMRAAALDAVIVTGAEPRSPNLPDEPYWAELTALLDFLRGGVRSTLYSCLAAHAAVLHRDGIPRRRLPRKLSGVFESQIVAPHELTQGLQRIFTPHSRYNALAECDLVANGYQILTRSREAGPDVFIRDDESLEVFWQGHPEYISDTLAREFRRDILRYFNHEWPRRPLPPQAYFDAAAMGRIQTALAAQRDGRASIEELMQAVAPDKLAPAVALWRDTAKQLVRNWLHEISRRKADAAADTFARVRWGG